MMLREEIIDFLGEDWKKLNDCIRESLHSDIRLLQAVNDDILSHGGKMLRPILSLLTARMVSGELIPDEAIKVAAATELLHNATLLHDDVADESTTRRGKPTLCSQIGPQAAVLVGDFWLAKAMDLVMNSPDMKPLSRIFSKSMTNLAEGEMLQLQKASGEKTEIKDYLRIIYCKTASLFETACESAALASHADKCQSEHIKKYAVALGIAFQIRDDILDYVGDASLGKPVGIDLREQKITLPLLCAMEGSEMEDEIRNMIFSIHSHPKYCGQIRTFVFDRGGVEKAEQILEKYVDDSIDELDCFAPCASKDYLIRLARYNKARRK